jgi:hypothetical protein
MAESAPGGSRGALQPISRNSTTRSRTARDTSPHMEINSSTKARTCPGPVRRPSYPGHSPTAKMKCAVFDLDGTLNPDALGLPLLQALVDDSWCDQFRAGQLFSFLSRTGSEELQSPASTQTACELYVAALTRIRSVRYVTQLSRCGGASGTRFGWSSGPRTAQRDFTIRLPPSSPKSGYSARLCDSSCARLFTGCGSHSERTGKYG